MRTSSFSVYHCKKYSIKTFVLHGQLTTTKTILLKKIIDMYEYHIKDTRNSKSIHFHVYT